MKYVRMKSGEIDIMEDGASIPAGSETIFSTDPSVYQGTWETEKLHTQRADVVQSKSETQKRLEGHMRGGAQADRPYWTEPTKAHPQDKVCLNCGKVMKGVRPNKKFCSDKCRKDYSQRGKRAEKRAIKSFKPHMGKEGQIFYMYRGEIGFIPALWTDSRKRTEKYIKDHYPEDVGKEVLEQVKEVI
jgi:predicted nucleic acid-binding Zn ribbon protein